MMNPSTLFNTNDYPELKIEKPKIGYLPQRCLICHNGIAYMHDEIRDNDPRYLYVSYIHYDEPVGIEYDTKTGKPIGFKYRTCGPKKTFLDMGEAVQTAGGLGPRTLDMNCPKCNRPSRVYYKNTDGQMYAYHTNEAGGHSKNDACYGFSADAKINIRKLFGIENIKFSKSHNYKKKHKEQHKT